MVNGYFNYMSANSESSLLRNGKVLTRRDLNGSDSDSKGINLEKNLMNVKDARQSLEGGKIGLDKSGFEILEYKTKDRNLDFLDSRLVIDSYYTECAEIVREKIGANCVVPFDHNIRSATGKKSKKQLSGGQEVQGPAHVVHGDYTLRSAPDRINQLSQKLTRNDTLSSVLDKEERLITKTQANDILAGRRFAIINLWRNIRPIPVETNPIALCNASTVSKQDLVVFEIHYSERVGENYFSKSNEKHEWFFYPNMTIDEALLIKQWDSHGDLPTSEEKVSRTKKTTAKPCTFSFHSAFEPSNVQEDAADRWSIEVRCVAIF